MDNQDMLEAYLNQVPESEREGARQLVHGMRLFAISAQKDLSPRVDLPLVAARSALLGLRTKTLQRCLDLLLGSLLMPSRPSQLDTDFGSWPESRWFEEGRIEEAIPRERVARAWRYLRGQAPQDDSFPIPGDSPESAATKLLNLAGRMHMALPWIRLWRIRCEWIQKGPRFADRALKRWCEQFGDGADHGCWDSAMAHRSALAMATGRAGLHNLVGADAAAEGRASSVGSDASFGTPGMPGSDPVHTRDPLEAPTLSLGDLAGVQGRAHSPGWVWDGTWGASGCWVACFPPSGSARWVQSPKELDLQSPEVCPDALERRALASLRVEFGATTKSDGAPDGARLQGTRVRACVCVVESVFTQSGGDACLGRILGWVTWEWQHDCIPLGQALVSTARKLVAEGLGLVRYVDGGRLREEKVSPDTNPGVHRWLIGMHARMGCAAPTALLERSSTGWTRKTLPSPGSAEPSAARITKLFDVERCTAIALHTGASPVECANLGGLVPLTENGTVPVMLEFDDPEGSPRGSGTAPQPAEVFMWRLANLLDGGSAAGVPRATIPLGDPSFAGFIHRLGRALQLPQHIVVIAHPKGPGPALSAWGSQALRGGRCVCMESLTKSKDDTAGLVEDWESKGEPFQVFRVPDLAERRTEILSIVAGVSGQRSPGTVWDDSALALMWRQSWSGQEPQLVSVISRIVGAGLSTITCEHVEQALRERAMEPLLRLESKRPRPGDLVAALHSTRQKTGRWNKTRASQYLGWDPDTLVARMGDLSWKDSDVPTPDPWGGGP